LKFRFRRRIICTALHRAQGGIMSLSKRTILAGTVPLVFVAAIHTSAWANPAKGADMLAATDGQEHRADQGSARDFKHDSDDDKDRGAHKDGGDNDRNDSDRSNTNRGDDRDRSGSPPGSNNPGMPVSAPEPETLALFGLGVLGTVLAQRRRRATLG
jgi:hypothetical protein